MSALLNSPVFSIFVSSLRLASPLMFAAYGGFLSEKSGIANIALECYLLFSAFVSAAVVASTQSLALGITAGILASAVTGALFAFFCIKGRGDQIIVGTAFNLLAVGLIPNLNRTFFEVSGATPALDLQHRIQHFEIFTVGAIALGFFLNWMLQKTRFGLRLTAAGDQPLALNSQGVSVVRLRFWSVTIGAAIAGFGGVMLSLCLSSGYSRDMSAGRGFIALSALIFGGWKPLPTMAGCLVFGFIDAIQINLQNQSALPLPSQIVQILPYVITLLLVTVGARRTQAPLAINRDLESLQSN